MGGPANAVPEPAQVHAPAKADATHDRAHLKQDDLITVDRGCGGDPDSLSLGASAHSPGVQCTIQLINDS